MRVLARAPQSSLVVFLGLALSANLGRAEWLPNGTPVKPSVNGYLTPTVVPDGRGGAYTAWTDRYADPRIQRLTADGDPAQGWPAEGTPTRKLEFYEAYGDYPIEIAPDGEGGAYVVSKVINSCWYHCNGTRATIWVQRITARGRPAPLWPAEGIPAIIGPYDFELHWATVPRIQPDGRHGLLIAWNLVPRGSRVATGAVYAQSISSSGTRRWGDAGRLISDGSGNGADPEIAPDGLGGAYVFWLGSRAPASGYRVFGQRLTRSGERLWEAGGIPVSASFVPFLIHEPFLTQLAPLSVCIADGSHDPIVAWSGAGTNQDVFAARVTKRGLLPWGAGIAICRAPGTQVYPRLVPSGSDGAIVVWQDFAGQIGMSIRAQRVDARGKLTWSPDGVVVCTAPGDRGPIAAVPDGASGAFVAWADARPEAALYATRLTGAGDRALGWRADGDPILDRVTGGFRDRRVEAVALAQVSDLHAMLVWQEETWDTTGFELQGPGRAMMLLAEGPAARLTPPALTGGVPSEGHEPRPGPLPALELFGVRPDPATPGASIAFTLADAAPAKLELFDVAGRALWSRDVGLLGAGRHVVTLGDDAWFPPGFYALRLRQGVRARSVHFSLLR